MCVDPGMFVSGVQVKLTEKSSEKISFSPQLQLILQRGTMVILKKTLIFQGSRGSNIFQGGPVSGVQ